jgi:hypothetical protein
MPIGVTSGLCAEKIAAIHLRTANAATVKKRIVTARFMLLLTDETARQQEAERILGQDRVTACRQPLTVHLQLRRAAVDHRSIVIWAPAPPLPLPTPLALLSHLPRSFPPYWLFRCFH